MLNLTRKYTFKDSAHLQIMYQYYEPKLETNTQIRIEFKTLITCSEGKTQIHLLYLDSVTGYMCKRVYVALQDFKIQSAHVKQVTSKFYDV